MRKRLKFHSSRLTEKPRGYFEAVIAPFNCLGVAIPIIFVPGSPRNDLEFGDRVKVTVELVKKFKKP